MGEFTAVPDRRGVVHGGESVERVFDRSAHRSANTKPYEADDDQNSGDDHGDFGALAFIADGNLLGRHARLVARCNHFGRDLLLQDRARTGNISRRGFGRVGVCFLFAIVVDRFDHGTPRGDDVVVHAGNDGPSCNKPVG